MTEENIKKMQRYFGEKLDIIYEKEDRNLVIKIIGKLTNKDREKLVYYMKKISSFNEFSNFMLLKKKIKLHPSFIHHTENIAIDCRGTYEENIEKEKLYKELGWRVLFLTDKHTEYPESKYLQIISDFMKGKDFPIKKEDYK